MKSYHFWGLVFILETTVTHEALYYETSDVIGNAIRKFHEEEKSIQEQCVPGIKDLKKSQKEEPKTSILRTLIKDITSLLSSQKETNVTNSDDTISQDLEEEVDEQDDADSNDDLSDSHISYGFIDEQLLAQNVYGSSSVDYNKMWYGEATSGGLFQNDDDYVTGNVLTDMDSDMLTDAEAYEVFTEIQYNAVLGGFHENQRERFKFDMWIKFNRGMFNFFEATALTNDVDYAPLR